MNKVPPLLQVEIRDESWIFSTRKKRIAPNHGGKSGKKTTDPSPGSSSSISPTRTLPAYPQASNSSIHIRLKVDESLVLSFHSQNSWFLGDILHTQDQAAFVPRLGTNAQNVVGKSGGRSAGALPSSSKMPCLYSSRGSRGLPKNLVS